MGMGGYSRHPPGAGSQRSRGPAWQADSVRALRRHMRLSQREMAAELGTRQQTVSEWETGIYRPRGASSRLLTIIAERAGFQYEVRNPKLETGEGKRRGDSPS